MFACRSLSTRVLRGAVILALGLGVRVVPTSAADAPEKELTNSIGMKLVAIPAGEFMMGGTEEHIAQEEQRLTIQAKGDLEKRRGDQVYEENRSKQLADNLERVHSMGPQHRVVITKSFLLGQGEVTQEEFLRVMGWQRSAFSAAGTRKKDVAGIDTGRYPVESVSWHDALEFCRQLSGEPEEKAAGRTYRLPTEAEWEYACRAGTTTVYYWGDKCGPGDSLASECAWHRNNSELQTHAVAQKKPNPWGLFDMLGNAGEWCADWYDPAYYRSSSLRDPTGPSSGTARIVRGGSSMMNIFGICSTSRVPRTPTSRSDFYGFRVACDVTSLASPVADAVSLPRGMKELEARLKEKGLKRQMGYFLLPEEARFIRYATTLERLRVACVHAQGECQEVRRQLDRVTSAKAAALKARMQARNYQNYSDTWRDYWNAHRAGRNATDAMAIADLSKEGLEKWQKDAQADFESAVGFFTQQIGKLREMFYKLETDYRTLASDEAVKKAVAEVNALGKAQYRLGPTPTALAAVKKLDREEELCKQFKKR